MPPTGCFTQARTNSAADTTTRTLGTFCRTNSIEIHTHLLDQLHQIVNFIYHAANRRRIFQFTNTIKLA